MVHHQSFGMHAYHPHTFRAAAQPPSTMRVQQPHAFLRSGRMWHGTRTKRYPMQRQQRRKWPSWGQIKQMFRH